MKKIFIMIFAILLIASCAGCRGRGGDDYIDTSINYMDLALYFDSSLESGTVEFTYPILNANDFNRIIPLGQINPPSHTFPTDHIYFVLTGLDKPVYAPTDSKIMFIEEPGEYGDRAIRIGVTDTLTYYLGHIFVDENLKVGDTIEAGTQIGISGNTACVDFGVMNKNSDNGFLNTRYPITTLYGDKPLSYYSESLKSEFYAKVKPPESSDHEYVYDGDVTDGEFAFDKLGSLSGNWFEEGCYREDGWYEWENSLAFLYDAYFPDQIRIGIGKVSNAFALKNEDNPIDPKDVSVSTGVVTYYLYNANNTVNGLPSDLRMGIMLVQMLSDTRIRLEIFLDTLDTNQVFTSASWFYVR